MTAVVMTMKHSNALHLILAAICILIVGQIPLNGAEVFTLTPQKERMEYAQRWAVQLGQIAAAIPNPTPEEEVWLKSELEDANKLKGVAQDRRFINIYSRPVFHATRPKSGLRACLKALKKITAKDTQADPKALQVEMLCWAEVLAGINDVTDNIQQFARSSVEAGKMTEKEARDALDVSDAKTSPSWTYFRLVVLDLILTKMLIPLLAEQAFADHAKPTK